MLLYFTGYWSFGYFSRIIDKSDILMLRKILGISKISNYIKQELSNKYTKHE